MRLDRREFLIGAAAASLPSARALAAQRPPLVLAAASLQESMNAAADVWARLGHVRPVLSFAASSALARQVAAGGAADLFFSADEPWMDDVQRRGLIVPGTRANLLGNRLVVVQPVTARAATANIPLSRLLASGRVALADPASVPAGRYAQASLQKLGLWNAVAQRVVRAENVRAALALVERGAAEWGVVYVTDARASRQVRAVRMLPASSHPPIRYPLARLKASTSPDAEGLRRFLLSPAGKAIFVRFGFQAL
ncbi:molybdate ABC transporter substrate-binding protein [Sphingomonas sp. LM7]|uniref:molybdate ABC transporter substrate-binding protein n=1 Tax=Sphingomonas sp. LM7 TaxID=1938607 RepID=UPI000983E85A|nr:molybdate ABC transporter substrate-binding protein [Sphingomonas sp. LM7]AQR73539.1 molybdate ABC transporter substrate-binding protein [Sphingomonas sp. LM7]